MDSGSRHPVRFPKASLGAVVSGAALVAVPKCPVCFGVYVAAAGLAVPDLSFEIVSVTAGLVFLTAVLAQGWETFRSEQWVSGALGVTAALLLIAASRSSSPELAALGLALMALTFGLRWRRHGVPRDASGRACCDQFPRRSV